MVSSTFPLDSQPADEPEIPEKISELQQVSPNRWVVNPWFDTLFVFGGLLWAFFATQYLVFHYDNPVVSAPGFAGHYAFFLLVAATLAVTCFQMPIRLRPMCAFIRLPKTAAGLSSTPIICPGARCCFFACA